MIPFVRRRQPTFWTVHVAPLRVVYSFILLFLCCAWLSQPSRFCHSFVLLKNPPQYRRHHSHDHRSSQQGFCCQSSRLLMTSRYEDSDGASKGIVSVLTDFVNSVSGDKNKNNNGNAVNEETTSTAAATVMPSPQSPTELLDRIRNDYIVSNYLWTGDLDLACFEPDCQFTDPTLSFTGTDTFARNLQNLRPIVDALTTTTTTMNAPEQQQADGSDFLYKNNNNKNNNCRSELLDIQLFPDYVQTRWNMVGTLARLPWQPKIDVIGRTKFWFRRPNNDTKNDSSDDSRSSSDDDGTFRVHFYDEEWEMPAWKALLQLITPAGTIRPTTDSKSLWSRS